MEASSGMHHTASVSVQPGYWPVEHNCHHKDILGLALRKLQGAQNGSIACRGLWRPQSQTRHPWEKPQRASCRKPAWLETCMSSRLPLRTRSRRGMLLALPLYPAQHSPHLFCRGSILMSGQIWWSCYALEYMQCSPFILEDAVQVGHSSKCRHQLGRAGYPSCANRQIWQVPIRSGEAERSHGWQQADCAWQERAQ